MHERIIKGWWLLNLMIVYNLYNDHLYTECFQGLFACGVRHQLRSRIWPEKIGRFIEIFYHIYHSDGFGHPDRKCILNVITSLKHRTLVSYVLVPLYIYLTLFHYAYSGSVYDIFLSPLFHILVETYDDMQKVVAK